MINGLSEKQISQGIVSVKWTTKDIIAHISAWNLELKTAINDLLKDEKPWFINEEKLTEAEFNAKETKKRKDWSLDQILDEWQTSFEQLIQRIMNLSKSEWEYQTPFEWTKDTPVTVKSLFEYTYKGEGHEGGHAQQIEEFYKKRNPQKPGK